MKKLFIFYSRANDALRVVSGYRNRAVARARTREKPISIAQVDVDAASEEDKKFWSGSATIECVTVDAGSKMESAVNPPISQLHQMIDNL